VLPASFPPGMARYRYVGGMRIAEVLAPILIGAALTLAAQIVLQLFIVPRVDTRRRRSERFERNVLDLGELLTSELDARAQQAYREQSWLRVMRENYRGPEFDAAKVERAVREQSAKARQVSWDLMGLVRARVNWLVERVAAFTPEADEIRSFQYAWMWYLLHAEKIADWPEDDARPDAEFEADWRAEQEARNKLTGQVKVLADLPHPPRAPVGGRLARRRRAARLARSLTSPTPPST
jgi:hypothetical protein